MANDSFVHIWFSHLVANPCDFNMAAACMCVWNWVHILWLQLSTLWLCARAWCARLRVKLPYTSKSAHNNCHCNAQRRCQFWLGYGDCWHCWCCHLWWWWRTRNTGDQYMFISSTSIYCHICTISHIRYIFHLSLHSFRNYSEITLSYPFNCITMLEFTITIMFVRCNTNQLLYMCIWHPQTTSLWIHYCLLFLSFTNWAMIHLLSLIYTV